MLFIIVTGLLFVAWYVWIRSNSKWATPHWKSLLAILSLVALSLSFAIYSWAIAIRKQDQFLGGVLMGMQPWPRIAGWCAIISMATALAGKRGTRVLAIFAALILVLSMFVAVLTD